LFLFCLRQEAKGLKRTTSYVRKRLLFFVGAIMFNRRAAGQRIFPSAAPLLPSPVPAAPSSAYLDSDGVPHEGEQPSMISASRSNPLAVPSFAKAGFLFRRLSIKR
jgi:hypothetical protein